MARIAKNRTRTSAWKGTGIDLSLARRQIQALIRKARAQAPLARRVPAASWTVDLHLVGPKAMTELNGQYRGKHYATDVLSFDAPDIFRQQGHLGELVICGAVLRRQAREQGHAPSRELQVLLAHGLLHLLGFDHELGPRAAREMGKWEARLLPRSSGLITRTGVDHQGRG
jgi:probable rRNA maturation factor